MATAQSYDGRQFPYLLMSVAGTAGDLIYKSTGSGARLASNSSAGTENTNLFIGVLVSNTAAGSYGAVQDAGCVELTKLLSTNKIEAGDIIYADGAAADNKVGTVAGGTAIGVCMAQSATSDSYVLTKIIPFYAMRGGYHA